MADALEFLRKAAFHKRTNPVAGGNRILWQGQDLIKLYDHAMSARREELICDDLTAVKSSAAAIPDRASLAKIGIELREFNPGDFAHLCLITNPTTDHTNDSVKPPGIDYSVFLKNPAVIDSHDSSKPPVATSGSPFMSGDNVLAIARWPKPGVSANSDQIKAAADARLLRGISIGFIPLRWSMSKDPSRPMGVDFHAIRLLEFSYCSLPMNPDCRVLGSVASNQSAPGDAKMADRRREARALAAKARALGESIPADLAPTREPIPSDPIQARAHRIAEARSLRRDAELAGRS